MLLLVVLEIDVLAHTLLGNYKIKLLFQRFLLLGKVLEIEVALLIKTYLLALRSVVEFFLADASRYGFLEYLSRLVSLWHVELRFFVVLFEGELSHHLDGLQIQRARRLLPFFCVLLPQPPFFLLGPFELNLQFLVFKFLVQIQVHVSFLLLHLLCHILHKKR